MYHMVLSCLGKQDKEWLLSVRGLFHSDLSFVICDRKVQWTRICTFERQPEHLDALMCVLVILIVVDI